MSSVKNKILRLTVLMLVMFLTGCPRNWNFVITDLSDPAFPSFCVSYHKRYCSSSGVDFSIFVIEEVDDGDRTIADGQLINPMWIIQSSTNSYLKEVKYGQVPEGWKELQPAKPLQIGQWYTANQWVYFRIKIVDGRPRAEILTLEEFLGKLHQKEKENEVNKE